MGPSATKYLGSYTFHSFTEGFQKFKTYPDVPDQFGDSIFWKLKYGEGEVDITVTTENGRHFLVFFFHGSPSSVFVYDSGHGTMNASQSNGMSHSLSGEQDHVTFVFHQPKDLTLLKTAKLEWSILADWIDLPAGDAVTVSVTVVGILTSTTSSL